MFEKKEQMIREQRTIDAMKKGFMGADGKLARIARMMGHPIHRHGTSNFNQTFLDDPYELPSDDLPVMDEDEMSYQIGFYFDGLGRGMQLEIVWLSEFREIKCRYRGRVVYRESGGELDGFAPGEEWETIVEKLYERTRKMEKVEKKVRSQAAGNEARFQQKEFLDAMKLKWGI